MRNAIIWSITVLVSVWSFAQVFPDAKWYSCIMFGILAAAAADEVVKWFGKRAN